MQSLFQDLRYASRFLIKQRGLTLIAVLTLALGIGANTAIFSLVNATLLRSLAVTNPEQLLYVFHGPVGQVFSYPDYSEIRDRNTVFDGMIAWGGIGASINNASAGDGADMVGGAIVSGNYFEVLGVKAALGRVISREDDLTPGAHPVVVIGHSLWQSRFGGDPNIVGRDLVLNGHKFTVIGVTPLEFRGAQPSVTRDLYVPMMMQAVMRPPRAGYSGEMDPDLLHVRGNRWLFSIGRLKPGVSAAQAQESLQTIARVQSEANPNTNQGRGVVSVSPVSEGEPAQRSQLLRVATLLMLVVAAVLLIACANVANLLLARASARRREIAVRLALGASRFRLIRQLLTESALLAVIGGGAGLLLASFAVEGMRGSPPPPGALPMAPEFIIDIKVLVFTLLLSMVAALTFGLVPAFRASRSDLVPALKDESAASGERSHLFSLRSILVISQVALSMVLLIAAGLFLRSLNQARSINPGFQTRNLLTLPLNINLLRYTRPQGREFYTQIVERVRALPGVQSASVARVVVLSGGGSVRGLMVEGRTGSESQGRSEGGGVTTNDLSSVNSNVVGLDYFQTMGIGFVRGRDFIAQDSEDRPRVVVVNEMFARRHFPGEEALGKRISFGGARGPWQEIVGIVRDSKYLTLGETPTRIAYLPLRQNHETGMTLYIRTAGDPMAVAPAIRREIQSLEKNLPVTNVRPMTDLLSASLYAARMGAILIGVFAALALLLGAIGLYGVMSFSVSRRTRELGLRMALGAKGGDVVRLVIGEGMILVAIGIGLGLVASAATTRFLATFLYGIAPLDVLTFTGVPIVLSTVALVACYVPARRAMKVDPMIALRYE